jgi:NADP-dependent 3-hydroxy acid dehydrogenase YdfG
LAQLTEQIPTLAAHGERQPAGLDVRNARRVTAHERSGWEHIVNISSVAGRTARAGSGVYNATKWLVWAFSEALRQETFRDKIRVTVIEPGAVATELTEHITNPAAKKEQEAWIRSLRPLQSEDIAAAIVFAVMQPLHVDINEILIRPTEQER